MALVCPAAKIRNYTYKKSHNSEKVFRFMHETVQTLGELSQLDRTGGWVAVLSAGGAQHAARRGCGGCSAVMGVVVVWWGAREDGVSVGGRAAELEPPQVLGVNGFVALQHFDGLFHGEPLPLTTYVDRVFPVLQGFRHSQHVHVRSVLTILVLLKYTKQAS